MRRIGIILRRRRARDERGATAVEYAIMVSAIAVMVIVAVVFLGQGTNSNLDCTGNSIVARATVC